MATGVAIGGAVIGLSGSRKQKKASKKAADEQAKLDKENTRLYQLEVGEAVSRTEDVNRRTESMAATTIGASGFGVGSSMDDYLTSIKKTHASDVEWMQTSGASQVAIQEREAAARQRNSRAQASAAFTKGVGSAISSFSGYQW